MKYNNSNKPLQCFMNQSTWLKSASNLTSIKGILWHSTGANNPKVSRYVQPDDTAANRQQLLNIIGVNSNKNDWNHITYKAGVHAFIGKLASGQVAAVQVGPWTKQPWGCGSGTKGSCNNGWLQFEICEDSLNDPVYFSAVYREACELTAYLCKMYNLNPKGTTTLNGVKVPVILCHADSYKLGLGSNHGDVLHWFPKYGKSIESVREDVAAIMSTMEEEEEDMTQDKFNEMMNVWIAQQADRIDVESWSAEARQWAEANGFVKGDDKGRKMYKKLVTREEMITVIHRILKKVGLA